MKKSDELIKLLHSRVPRTHGSFVFSTAKKSPEATGGEIGQIMVDVILNHIAAPCAAALEVFGPWKSEGR